MQDIWPTVKVRRLEIASKAAIDGLAQRVAVNGTLETQIKLDLRQLFGLRGEFATLLKIAQFVQLDGQIRP